MRPAPGFVIVRDGGSHGRPLYLGRDRDWRHDAADALIFASTKHARQWIETRPLAYWLLHSAAGPPRVISARAAGVFAV